MSCNTHVRLTGLQDELLKLNPSTHASDAASGLSLSKLELSNQCKAVQVALLKQYLRIGSRIALSRFV